MALSDAVSLQRVSRIVGWKAKKGNFLKASPNLPQRIAIIGEANTANQGSLDTNKKQITSAKQAGELYGFGSPIHSVARILFPISGDGVGGIPVLVYPQASAGATAAKRRIDIVGTATKTTTHTVVINGREGLDGVRYDFVVTKDDTNTELVPKIVDAINNILGTPVTAVLFDNGGTDVVDCTAKWTGLTSEELDVKVITNGEDAGLTYGITSEATGAGSPAITGATDQFGNEWNTIVINTYGTVQHANLEAFNGVPDPDTPTGRYAAILYKPFIAVWGSTDSDMNNLIAITDAADKKDQVTNALCPAPNSKGFSYEAAANGAYLFALVSQNTPNLDVSNMSYPDMPVPSDQEIGDMANYNNRDLLVKAGSSTVDLINGKYTFMDFVTTYHPDGETPPQYRYCRNLMLDYNYRFGYLLLEIVNVIDHTIVGDDQAVNAPGTVKPKQWKQVLNGYFDDLSVRALIVEKDFAKDSLDVQIGETNPDRFETFFRLKRSSTVRVASTTAEIGFSFGG